MDEDARVLQTIAKGTVPKAFTVTLGVHGTPARVAHSAAMGIWDQ